MPSCEKALPMNHLHLEYVRYGIDMKMETHKAIRSQHKTIEETKIIKMI